MQTVPGS